MAYILVEYLCPSCGRFESLEQRPSPAVAPCEGCGGFGERAISAVKSKTVWGWAETRGRPEPAPAPTAMDTAMLGDGMSRREWKAQRTKMWRDHDRARRRAKGAPV